MQDIPSIIDSAKFRAAQDALRAGHDRLVEDIITLTEIPSPPFKEDVRAAAYLEMFKSLGLRDAKRDAVGNVTGIRPGKGKGLICVASHLDTVFPEGTDTTVRREGTRLFAPGVGDDTRGLAVLLSFVRALDAAGIETEADLLFVGDVGEEGTGDLRGIRHLFSDGEYAKQITGFFSIDGLEVQELTTGAVGSLRYHLLFRGPGGHSFGAFGTVNPAHCMAAVVSGLSQSQVPATPRTTFCASMFGGGSSVNAIPEEVWVDVDLRSEDPVELARLDTRLKGLIEAALADENARGSGTVSVEITPIGDRPAGNTPEDAPIVQTALAAIAAFGFTPSTKASSTDANIPMSLGIPAVTFGSGGTGGRAHSLEEWIDVEPELSLRGLYAGLAAILGTAGLSA